MRVAVCWKWVSVDTDDMVDSRWAGVSLADEAALEIALQLVDSSGVTVVCLGPVDADDTLRSAIAVGASGAIRIDASPELDSHTVATALADELGGFDLVVCGDYSLDRGTGSVPAFLAAELGSSQALGLVEIDTINTVDARGAADPLRVVRRLDGGRREVLDVSAPAVISVEGAVARLRRASLASSLSARSVSIAATAGPYGHLSEAEVHPYRPRARSLPAPTGSTLGRVREILGIDAQETHTEALALPPVEAATKIVEQLRDWGYLECPQATGN